MDESEETLRRTIGRLTNDVLLKRWASGGFSDKALAVAEAEIARRGLDTSAPAVARVHHRDAKLEAALHSRRRALLWRRVLLIIGIVVAAAIAAKLFAPARAATADTAAADAAPVLQDFAFIGCSGDWDGVSLAAPEVWRATADGRVAFIVHHVASCGLDGSGASTRFADGVLDLSYDLQSSSGAAMMCECEYWATFTFGADAAAIATVTFRGGKVDARGEWPPR